MSRTPLSLAVSRGALDQTRQLLEQGADVNAMSGPHTYQRHSVLKTACLLRRDGSGMLRLDGFQIVELLLSYGANVNYVDESDGTTALHDAARIGNVENVKVLLRYGAEADKRDVNKGNTPLMMCIHNMLVFLNTGPDGVRFFQTNATDGVDHMQVAKILIEAGGGVNVCNHRGRTPLHEATSNANIDAMKLLVESGAILDARDNVERRPVELALYEFIVDDSDKKGALWSIYMYISDQMKRVETERKEQLCMEQFKALAMGQHPRLGADSPAIYLSPDALTGIWEALRKEHGLSVE
jgi:ankyrin repeat protein